METTGSPKRIGLWIILGVGLVYCLWLASHWLPLPYSEHELAASASRVWDIKTEWTTHHQLPWWTPNFMSGSSYAINHSRGFYLLPWIALSAFTDLATAGKLMALLAIFASGVAMYFCARHFLRNEWAAALAGIAFVLHPAQLIRAAGAEHMTISLFFPFIPLLWLTFARMLEKQRPRDIALCALTACFAMWTDNKQAVINFLFLGAYLVYWFWPAERRQNLQRTGRTFGLLAVLGLTTGAFIIWPGVVEMKHIKLFQGDPLAAWQKNYAFRSLFGLVDRDGVATKGMMSGILAKFQAQPPTSQAQVDAINHIFGMQMDAPEKYAGLVFLVALAATALWNYRRENRGLFWFFVGMLLLSLMLATGFGNVLSANLKTFEALSTCGGMPGAAVLALLALVVFLVLFARRKLTTPQRWGIAGGTLAAFLLVPAFDIVARFPYFKDIRAPYSFYDGPVAFWVAILIGFAITDVVRKNAPQIVAGLAVLLLVDYWPYQEPTLDNGVPASTIKNFEAAYGALRQDPDWVKTYSMSGRYFHLLGPMYSGKPQVYEAFYNWQAPVGLGLLHNAGGGTREFLNLIGARYIVIDKTDPGMRQQPQLIAAYRQAFPVAVENDDFVVLRNAGAHPYVSATTRVCVDSGPSANAGQVALALSAHNYTVAYTARDGFDPIPPVRPSEPLALQDVRLTRENHHLIRIQLTAPQACVAVIAESFYPFWRATVDGQPVEVMRVNCGLMGVSVTPGAHEVVLRYQPPGSYRLAALVSGLGLLGILGVCVWRQKSGAV